MKMGKRLSNRNIIYLVSLAFIGFVIMVIGVNYDFNDKVIGLALFLIGWITFSFSLGYSIYKAFLR